MIYRVIIRPQAEADVAEAALWYREHQIALGSDFFNSVKITIRNAVENPRRFPRIRQKPEVRRALTDRFPYRIFFLCTKDSIVIFRVLHSSRHEREWKTHISPQ